MSVSLTYTAILHVYHYDAFDEQGSICQNHQDQYQHLAMAMNLTLVYSSSPYTYSVGMHGHHIRFKIKNIGISLN